MFIVTRTENLNSETLATYFQELNFNIIEYCEEKYPVQSKYFFNFESETETGNKGKQRLKQYSKTTPNTLTLQKTTAKHLQTPEQRTSVKLPLSITPFPISLVQPQTPNSLLNHFFRLEDFQSPKNPTQQQEPISTSANIIDYLQENESNHSESLESKETKSEPKEITEKKKKWQLLTLQKSQNLLVKTMIPVLKNDSTKFKKQKINAAVNEQKAITAMYTEATVKGKPIHLILDSGLAGNRPAQTVIVTADGMKKTPVGEIDDFPFSIDGITISIKVLWISWKYYHLPANATTQMKFIVTADGMKKTPVGEIDDFPFSIDGITISIKVLSEIIELKISYQGQYTIVPATCGTFNKQSEKAPVFEFKEEKEMPLTETYMAFGSTSNWAEKTEQEIFEESRGWKKVRYSTPEPQKQPPYIPLKCKDCNKKLSSMRACISPEEEYETCTCYFCKACHRE
ncbi:hypothetical protein G9A89_011144 [Geosiphon pyriformis]|nr:hypothetical protein G9A89_011144 [Geosiphon pyriformis]